MSCACPICCEDLGADDDGRAVEHFKYGSSEDHDVGSLVFRLSCGHAFHTACIVRALRTKSDCPTCRAPAQEENAANVIVEMRGAQGPMEVQLDLTNLSAIDNALVDLHDVRRTDAKVQNARRRMNTALRAFHEHESRLCKLRRECLDNALTEFRKQFRAPFEATRRHTQQAMRRVKRAEHAAVANKLGVEHADYVFEVLDIDMRQYDLMTRNSSLERLGPLRHKFWTLH